MTKDIPGALLGVVGGAGVLKGSKFTDSELDWGCFFCGRGVAGDRDVLLGWLQLSQVNNTINYCEVQYGYQYIFWILSPHYLFSIYKFVGIVPRKLCKLFLC